MSHNRFKFGCVTIVLLASAGIAQGETPPSTQWDPFLQQHCFDCHSGETPEGGLNLRTQSVDFLDAEVRRRWVYLYDRVANGEMPPKSVASPDAKSKSKFLRALGDSLVGADLAGREVVLRRLNRTEYENTVRDLFDIHVDVQSILPDDSAEQGFDTIGSDLSISAEQMVIYIEAADLVLDQVFGPPKAPKRIDETVNIKDLRSRTTADQVLPGGVVLFSGAKSLPMYGASVPSPGVYRLRIHVKAIQCDRPVVMQVHGGVTGRIPAHVAGFFEVPPGKFTTIELTDRAVERGDTFSFKLVGGYPWWKVNAAEYKGPGLFLGDIEIEGPLEEWPRPSRVKLLGDIDPANGTLKDIAVVLSRVLPRAFRRSIGEAEARPYVALAKQALDEGLSFEKALRRGLKGVLCAPEFLFMEESLTEDDATENDAKQYSPTIDDFALASRLSYFLWSSLPDRDLLSLAKRGELKKPDVLRAQVQRMLGDPKSERFVENFTGQWLMLRDIDFTVPDRRLYPEYSQLLRRSMLDETHAFFREILDHDHSVQNFVDSDFVMINEPLAKFYDIDGVKGLRIRRVELPRDSVRGGVLTQASVLKVSADGTRTSPVLRGAWILENLFGAPPPPPPPTVAAIEPDIRGATTIREQLAKHRNHQSCNRCHRKIDPPGFALENFDVIGGWRDWYRTKNGKYVNRPRHPQAPDHHVLYRQGPDVDPSGTLPDGRKFAGIREYKRFLLEDETAIARSLTRLLLTYSLGRRLGFSDRPEVERILAKVKTRDYGLRSLVHKVVQSKTFQSP